jgi:hypothetical protein
LDLNPIKEYNTADLLLLHQAYDHASNALMTPRMTAVADINNDEQHSAGWDGPEGGGHYAFLPPWRSSL